jgi:hypothetical protein
MAGTFLDFEWSVEDGSYRWFPLEGNKVELPETWSQVESPDTLHDANHGGPEVKVLAVTKPTCHPGKPYQPLQKYDALFRTFANLAPSEEAILSFADRYGRLTDCREHPLEFEARCRRADQDSDTHLRGETYPFWCAEIETMRRTISLWDLMQKGDRNGLSKHIRWEKQGTELSVFYDSHPDQPVASRPDNAQMVRIASEFSGDMSRQYRLNDPVLPAQTYLQGVVNEKLARGVISQLLPAPETRQLTLYHVPRDLLGALWLQFARAMSGNKAYRVCKECGQWFEVSPERSRTTRQFCSDACKSKAYRGRKKGQEGKGEEED